MYIGGLSHGGLCLPCCGVLCSCVGGLPCPSQCKTLVTYDKLVFLCNCGNRLYLYENMLHAACMQYSYCTQNHRIYTACSLRAMEYTTCSSLYTQSHDMQYSYCIQNHSVQSQSSIHIEEVYTLKAIEYSLYNCMLHILWL